MTPAARYVETYCYALTAADFLENEPEQLYWRTGIVQMTRYFILEAARCGVRLSPRKAGFPVCPKVASAGSRVSDTVLRLWGDRNYRSESVFGPPGYAETWQLANISGLRARLLFRSRCGQVSCSAWRGPGPSFEGMVERPNLGISEQPGDLLQGDLLIFEVTNSKAVP